MLWANFKPKRIAAASRGFLATARLSCIMMYLHEICLLVRRHRWKNDSVYCDACYRSVVCPSACMSSVTLMHPAKAVGRNEMPFGRHLRCPTYTVLARVPTRRNLGVGTPVRSDSAYHQITLALGYILFLATLSWWI